MYSKSLTCSLNIYETILHRPNIVYVFDLFDYTLIGDTICTIYEYSKIPTRIKSWTMWVDVCDYLLHLRRDNAIKKEKENITAEMTCSYMKQEMFGPYTRAACETACVIFSLSCHFNTVAYNCEAS